MSQQRNVSGREPSEVEQAIEYFDAKIRQSTPRRVSTEQIVSMIRAERIVHDKH